MERACAFRAASSSSCIGPRRSFHQQLCPVLHSRTRIALRSGPDAQSTVEKLPSTLGALVTDDAVPEGHQGLHGFLYGAGGAEEHDGDSGYRFRQDEDDGSTLLAVSSYLESRDGEKPLGVYALYDTHHDVQYISYSRNIVLAVKAHLARVGEDKCAFVRPMVFANRSMASRTNLEQQVANWLADCGTMPPGNGLERDRWEGRTAVDTSLMSPSELSEYEDKKLKLRKAMGEDLAKDGGADETDDIKQRRLKLMAALQNDDWSSVIDGQTQATVDPVAVAAAGGAAAAASGTPSPSGQISSPFSRASVHRSIGNAPEPDHAVMTVESVDKALDEVRPYLIADGGNVEVAGVQGGVVMLRLEGACGTCPSSTATMKMGIERALRSHFGEQLKEVMQVDKRDMSASVASVNEHLDTLRPAIAGLGGSVEVLGVEGGVCSVRYNGPAPLAMGITAAIKDRFPDVTEVVLSE